MKLDFAKLQGCGNDFVFVDDFSRERELTAEQVTSLCDRHFGIGADGVILVRASDDPKCAAYMHYINSDGTLSEMCGNGVRCFAKYLVDRGFVPASDGHLTADTLAGPKPISFDTNADDKLTYATVDMGQPVLDPDAIPVASAVDATSPQGIPFVKDLTIASPWGDFSFTCVSMGNPHAVCFVDDWEDLPDNAFCNASDKSMGTFDVESVGAFFESHEAFPAKANIEFAEVGNDSISMRVFERGCGETLACGTGACATSVAASLTDRTGRKNDVELRGGTLRISWEDNGHVMMTGPAEESFHGTVEI